MNSGSNLRDQGKLILSSELHVNVYTWVFQTAAKKLSRLFLLKYQMTHTESACLLDQSLQMSDLSIKPYGP